MGGIALPPLAAQEEMARRSQQEQPSQDEMLRIAALQWATSLKAGGFQSADQAIVFADKLTDYVKRGQVSGTQERQAKRDNAAELNAEGGDGS